jgi:hypothetical protein
VARAILAGTLLAASTSACLNMLARADSHPIQSVYGLTPVQYGDTVVGEPEPGDAGGDRGGGRE